MDRPHLLCHCLLEGGDSEALSSEIAYLVPLTSITLFSKEVSFAVNLSEMRDSSDENSSFNDSRDKVEEDAVLLESLLTCGSELDG